MREGTAGATIRVNLPLELADRYSPIDELDSGSEAFVLKVRDSVGTEFVAKLYHSKLTFDENALASIATSQSPRIVKVIEQGRAADNGARFEILEWCQYGSLRNLLDNQAELNNSELVQQLNRALADIHSLLIRSGSDADVRVIHQDLKPENVMVRSIAPLNLAVGDFGLVRIIAGSRHYTNRQQGSRSYAPPSGEALSTGWDYWSLGMLVLESALGEHPFRVNGQWLSDNVISDILSQGPVDTSRISDARLRTLCRGLLARRTSDRWGFAEVEKWLEGEEVLVVPDHQTNETREISVLFNSVEYSEVARLTVALQADWARAQEQLIQRTDGGVLSQQVGLLLTASGMVGSQQLLADTANPPARLANLLLSLNADLRPIYRGTDIRPSAISSGLSDPTTAAGYLNIIENKHHGLAHTGVLTCWRTLEGMSSAPQVEARIQRAFLYLKNQDKIIQEWLDSDGIKQLKVATYVAATNPGSETKVRASLKKLDLSLANERSWFRDLVADPNDYAPILALHTEHIAREQTTGQNVLKAAEEQERQRLEKERIESEKAREIALAESQANERERLAERKRLQEQINLLEIEIVKHRKWFGGRSAKEKVRFEPTDWLLNKFAFITFMAVTYGALGVTVFETSPLAAGIASFALYSACLVAPYFYARHRRGRYVDVELEHDTLRERLRSL
jgi:serine/threonine protein kinase